MNSMTMNNNERLIYQKHGKGLNDTTGFSWPDSYCNILADQQMVIDKDDRKILRELAWSINEIISSPGQVEKRKKWEQHNDLIETHPLIFCDPELAWYEILPAKSLQCRGNLARILEFRLRKEIYWVNKIKDDHVVPPQFVIHQIFSGSSRGLETEFIGVNSGGSYSWKPPLSSYKDVKKLRLKKIVVDKKKTDLLFELARDIFEEILEVRLGSSYYASYGMTSDLVFLRGFEQVLIDMYDNPEGIHSLMKFLRDEILANMDFLENNNLLSLNSEGDYVGTGGYGYTNELPLSGFDYNNVTTMDMWGFSENQETNDISPEFYKEYIFPYQKSILERFGLNIYGCCEPLDRKWEIIKSLPRLRRVTVSPWSDEEFMAKRLGRDYVYCKKVNPAYVSQTNIDEESARREIRRTLRAAKRHNCPVEVMLRNILTLSCNSDNVITWTKIAKEEVERIYR